MKKLLAVLLAALLAALTASCALGKKKESKTQEELFPPQETQEESTSSASEESGPEAAARLAYEALKALDVEKMALYIEGMDASSKIPAEAQGTAELLVQDLKCEFSAASSGGADGGDTAVVRAKITNRDFSGVLTSMLPSVVLYAAQNPGASQEELTRALSDQLAAQLAEAGGGTITKDVDLTAVQKDGEWKIRLNKEAADALFGGLLGGMEGLAEKFGIDLPGLPAGNG